MRKIVLILCVIFLGFIQVNAQTRTVTGKVTDDKGNPLRGVSVREVSPDKRVIATAVTSEAGTFSIKVSDRARNLQFSSVGFVEASASVVNLRGALEVKLLPNIDNLAEVVVTTAAGLKTRRKDMGYASTQVSGDKITATHPTTIQAGLAGKVAGLTISATSGGVNPSFRITLRGMRSITGNNEALIVLDNVIIPSALLGNLNPEDVEDVVVLNGASAAALYGSDASNGALLITTKKGAPKGAKPQVVVTHTLTREEISFFPKLQLQFGSGSSANFPIYTPDENQQYGPAFDGIVRPIGQPLADGSIQSVAYSPTNAKNDFWQKALSNQTDVSFASNDDRGSMRVSAQYVDGTTTTPGDKFTKVVFKIGGKRTMTKNLELTYSLNYTQNRYDITTQSGTIYAELMQTSAQIPVNDYKDWKNDKYSTPSGYYNPFYRNPYFLIDNYRQLTRNDYMLGSMDFKYSPLSWLDLTFRNSITTRNNSGKSFSDKYTYSDFAKATTHGTYKKTDVTGSVTEATLYTGLVTSELQLGLHKKYNDFNIRFTGGGSLRQDIQKSTSESVSGIVVPGLFNLSNTLVNPSASESFSKTRKLGLYGDLNIGYKNYLNLHGSARNDWDSRLNPEFRSFFYPAFDIAFSPMELFPTMKNSQTLTSLKLRGGWSKVGQTTAGAYALLPTFGQAYGYPYAAGGGFTLGDRVVTDKLKPEFTTGYEVGFDAGWWKNRITTNFTYYSTISSDQTVSTGISWGSGFSSYLLNAAKTSNKGIEATVNATLLRNRDWELTVGAVYTHVIESKVLAIYGDVNNISLGSGVYAFLNQPFPVIYSTAYLRDSVSGKVIVDAVTGAPLRDANNKILGSTNPKDILGLNFSLSWKSFHLSAQAEYRGGYVTLLGNATAFEFSGGGMATVAFNRDRFVFPNSVYFDAAKGAYVDNTNITVRDGGYNFWAQSVRTGVNENYVASGAFWKLREVTLSYDLPEKALSSIKFIKKASISLQGRNLLMLLPKTNLYTDPEYSDNGSTSNGVGVAGIASPPPSRFYGASISLTF
ncbi:MAG: SusC/RagA family TonB-linked outer membrane protein [Bacteroidota bacterium]